MTALAPEQVTALKAPIDQVLALKAARRAEQAAEKERARQHEQAYAEADAVAFEQALTELLAREFASGLLAFRSAASRNVPAGADGYVRFFRVLFHVPGHRTVAVMLACHAGRYGPAGETCDDMPTWWAEPPAPDGFDEHTDRLQGFHSLADALIAAEEIPY